MMELETARFMLLCLIILGIKVVKPTPQFWIPFAFHLAAKEGDVDAGVVALAMFYSIAIGTLVTNFCLFLDYVSDPRKASDILVVWNSPFIFSKMFISSYCFVSMGYLAYHVSDEIKRVQWWQGRGMWLDIMRVDSLAAKLYVF